MTSTSEANVFLFTVMPTETNLTSDFVTSAPNIATQFIPLLSYETRIILETINFAILSFLISMFGIVANVINIVIFYKQGLDKTTNINFFALAISDLCSLITLQWVNLCFNPLFANSDVPIDAVKVQYLTGSWPHACFGHTTCWITAYMTAERCLCIALPLKVKEIITPKRTTIIVCLMYAVNLMSFIPEYSYNYLDWKFFADRNRSLLTLVSKENSGELEGLSFIVLAVFGTASFPAVIVFTIILHLKLKQQAKWRQKATRDSTQTDLTSRRDTRTMNMVVLVACVLIVCYTPGAVGAAITFFEPRFSIKGDLINTFLVCFSFAFLFAAVNSSVNIFLYYRMSTKYKTIFREMFSICWKQTSGGTELGKSTSADLQEKV